MTWRKFFTGLGLVAVTVVAGLISYRHQSHLAGTHGQPEALAAVWPLCVDGLVLVTGVVIANDRAAGMLPRWWALVGFWLGVTVSVLTNWLATSGGLINHGVSAFPALAFLVAVESLSAKPRPAKGRQSVTAPAEAAILPDAPQVDEAKPADKPKARKSAPKAAKVAEVIASRPDLSTPEAAKLAGVSTRTARRVINGHAVPELVEATS